MPLFLAGILIGMVLGLSGSGGALVSIPLFMALKGLSLKEATTLSLLSVFLGGILNVYPVRKEVDLTSALPLLPFSFLASYLTLPAKTALSDNLIVALLTLISLISLFLVWSGNSSGGGEIEKRKKLFFSPVVGLGLGALSTLTGLGGGVILLPVFLRLFHLPLERAVSTSLLVVSLSSAASFAFQYSALKLPTEELLWLSSGLLLSAFFMVAILRLLPPSSMSLVRKVSFTVVVGLTLLRLFRIG